MITFGNELWRVRAMMLFYSTTSGDRASTTHRLEMGDVILPLVHHDDVHELEFVGDGCRGFIWSCCTSDIERTDDERWFEKVDQ